MLQWLQFKVFFVANTGVKINKHISKFMIISFLLSHHIRSVSRVKYILFSLITTLSWKKWFFLGNQHLYLLMSIITSIRVQKSKVLQAYTHFPSSIWFVSVYLFILSHIVQILDASTTETCLEFRAQLNAWFTCGTWPENLVSQQAYHISVPKNEVTNKRNRKIFFFLSSRMLFRTHMLTFVAHISLLYVI